MIDADVQRARYKCRDCGVVILEIPLTFWCALWMGAPLLALSWLHTLFCKGKTEG